MPSGGPRMLHEPRHNQRKQMMQLNRRKRSIDRDTSVAEIDMEYDKIEKEW